MRPVLLWCTILACALNNLFVQAENDDLTRCGFDRHEEIVTIKNNRNDWEMCCDESTFLKIAKLCAHRLKSDVISSQSISTKKLCAKTAVNDLLCTTTLQADIIQSNKLETMDLCANAARIQNLCVDSLTTSSLTLGSNFEMCTNFRAYVSDVVTHTQIVGDFVFFDTVVDDPNSSITNTTSTSYTVPKSGYYMATASIGIKGLVGPVLTGIPVSVLQINVNGTTRVQERNSFLSFSIVQESAVSALLILNAGDVIRVGYQLIVQDPSLGEIVYPGTITIGGAAASNFFAIHYLSSMCPPNTGNTGCAVQCAPISISCADCTGWCEAHSHN